MREYNYPAASATIRFIDRPGDVEPPLVFLHGLGSASSYAFPAVALSRELASRRALLVDFLGFGYSDRPSAWSYTLDSHAEAVAALLDAEGLSGCCVIGHSMGGTIAILLASARPDLVASLVVAEANLDSSGGTVSSLIAAQSEEAFVARGQAEFARAYAGDPRSAGYAATFALASPVALHRSARGLVEPRSPSAGEILRILAMPRSFLVGELNLPYPDAEGLSEAGVAVVTIPRAGHNMSIENPAAFAAAVASRAMVPTR